MGFLRRFIGGDEPERDRSGDGEPPGPDVSDAEASRAEPTPGLLGDLPWVPAARVASLAAVLSAPLLAALLGEDEARLRAWTAETEPVSERQLARIAFLEELAGRLGGRRDEFGVRRWFDRPRPELDGRSVRETMSGDWSPDDEVLVSTLVALTGTGSGGDPER